jgi:SAM-dependent methyltransferase
LRFVHELLSLGLLAICMSTLATGASQRQESPTPPIENPQYQPAFLGVDMGSQRQDNINEWGVRVFRVVTDSSASHAGVRTGDRILGLDGHVVETIESFRRALTTYRKGDAVQLVFLRAKEMHVVRLVFVERPVLIKWDDSTATNLQRVLDFIEVQPGQVIADVGRGYGWLSIGLAEATGPGGMVYGLQINEALVTELQETSIANLTWVQSQETSLSLSDNLLDVAVLHDVASHVREQVRPKFYASLARTLKPTGKLIVFAPHGQARAMLDELASFHFIPENQDKIESLPVKELDELILTGIRFSCVQR